MTECRSSSVWLISVIGIQSNLLSEHVESGENRITILLRICLSKLNNSYLSYSEYPGATDYLSIVV